MRTTLEIEDSVLAIARARAQRKGISLGAAVSELIRRGIELPVPVSSSGFPTFTPPPGAPPVTDELVARYRDEDPVG